MSKKNELYKVIYKDVEYDAYTLPIEKEFAQQIAAGTKTVEIRIWSDFNTKRFIDREAWKKNDELVAQGRADECVPVLKNIFAIHFYDRAHGAFELDVLLDECGIASMTKEDIGYLADTYGYHDQDNEWQQFANMKKEEIPSFFWFHIDKVVKSEGLS